MRTHNCQWSRYFDFSSKPAVICASVWWKSLEEWVLINLFFSFYTITEVSIAKNDIFFSRQIETISVIERFVALKKSLISSFYCISLQKPKILWIEKMIPNRVCFLPVWLWIIQEMVRNAATFKIASWFGSVRRLINVVLRKR